MPDETPILAIGQLQVRFRTPDGEVEAVKGASLTVASGETIAVVGESGSGKSQLMMAAMGLLAQNGSATGSVRYRGTEILGLSTTALNRIRGRHLAMIFQEPMTSLDPLYPIGEQVAEPIRTHQRLGHAHARRRVLELLDLVRIPDAASRLGAYPHELSGGQRQRVMIAMAIANDPDVLIADEPTTALDVTIQAEILALLADLQRRLGMGLVLITHDLGIVRRIASRVAVMRRGEIVEEGATASVFAAPRHAYTRALIDAEPAGRKLVPAGSATMLSGDRVSVAFKLGGRWLGGGTRTLQAVDSVSLTLKERQTVGVVGESGSGKSTLARALLRLLPSTGTITFHGRDITHTTAAALRPLRRELQIVLQDPFGSLSPRMTVGQIVTEGLDVHEPGIGRDARSERAVAALREVELGPAFRNRYPHELSGGQRQRVAIARAIVLRPKVLVLDEPTSALDRQVQKAIIELLRRLQAELGLAYLLITHDLAVVRAMADHIIVMKEGRMVEEGSPDQIFGAPRQAYTQRLVTAALLSASHTP